jgi:DNA-binding response OmpR family regulator
LDADSQNKKILVVDDDLNMRIFISTVLKTSGYTAFAARDGKEGFRKAEENAPDLIILDVMMPDEGGVLMYRNLKSHPKMKCIPVVMLSGVESATFSHTLKLLNLGLQADLPEPEAYLEKPPKPDELLQTIKEILKAQ